MKPQEDIGSLIKTKLQATEKVSNEATWERIQHSLEKRKQKRRFAFYIRLGSAGLLVLMGALFLINYVSDTNKNTTTFDEEIGIENPDTKSVSKEKKADYKVSTEITTGTNLENKETSELKSDISKQQETLSNTTVSKTATGGITETKKESTKNTEIQTKPIAIVETKEEKPETNHSRKDGLNTKVIDTILNSNDVPVTQTTQKVYYYYNSKNGQEISSMDKGVIDSIVKANQVKPDSLKTNN